MNITKPWASMQCWSTDPTLGDIEAKSPETAATGWFFIPTVTFWIEEPQSGGAHTRIWLTNGQHWVVDLTPAQVNEVMFDPNNQARRGESPN